MATVRGISPGIPQWTLNMSQELDTEQPAGARSSSPENVIPRARRNFSDVWMLQASLQAEDLRIRINLFISGYHPGFPRT